MNLRRSALPDLPSEWLAADTRDRSGDKVGADPLPERRAARLLAAFIVTGLFFLALPGTFMGVGNLLLIAAERTPGAPSPAWIQAHGQAQVFGWVGSFILGISLYILPKFRGIPLRSFALGWLTWAAWSGGVALRWQAGIGIPYPKACLIASGVLELIAYELTQYLLVIAPGRAAHRGAPHVEGRSPRSRDAGSLLGIVGFGGLGVVLLLNLAGAFAVLSGSAAYPAALDRLLVELALWIFVVPIAVAYSTRFVTIFAGLRPSRFNQSVPFGQKRVTVALLLSAGLAGIAIATLARLFPMADALAFATAIGLVWALRIFEPSVHPAKVAGVYRGYPVFIRLAYGWLVAGAGIAVVADVLPGQIGIPGAARHAITVGYVATLIFALGPRILPNFLSSRQLFSRMLMAWSLWLLTLGCLMRVISETVAYGVQVGWAWRWLPISAFIELTAVLLFVANLALTIAHAPPAWLRLETITGEVSLYWCIASYPRTRPLLVRAGLSTLGRVRDVPHSLRLREAASADGISADDLVSVLRNYFKERQPRTLREEPPRNETRV